MRGPAQKVRLPAILRRLRAVWLASPPSLILMTSSFGHRPAPVSLDIFRAGETTVPSTEAFDAAVHLAWGECLHRLGYSAVKDLFLLKRSKTDQFGRGVEVFVGATGDEICPVRAVTAYAAT